MHDATKVTPSVISARRTIVIPKIAIDRIAFYYDVGGTFEVDGVLGVETNNIVSDYNTLVDNACFRIPTVERFKLNAILDFTPLQYVVFD